MKPISSAPAFEATSGIAGLMPVHFVALDHGPWLEVQRSLRQALAARGQGRIAAPMTVILNDLLDAAVKAMHLRVFRRIMETDFGLSGEGNDDQAKVLYANELSEHGSQNIAHACKTSGWKIAVSFPAPVAPDVDVVVRIDVPFAWTPGESHTHRLLDALEFRFAAENSAAGTTVLLTQEADRHGRASPPALLSPAAGLEIFGRISEELGYGLIQFSPVGEIVAVSPSMLARLRIDQRESWAQDLERAIPLAFHNDVVWGQALADGSGAFENFRIRVTAPGKEETSILFNVSGFRMPDGTVVSLWQAVSEEEGQARLSEGSILSGMRIHAITRHYVPQLVEQKAREAVAEGKDSITDEDRQVAVLFCDIVGFTSYVECNADNESIVETLNFILSRVSRSVTRNGGAIDKFMGDCIMAIFDDPADAIRAGLDMQSHSEDLNRLRSRAGQQTLQLRIGIHWGDVAICNVGIPERLDWTAIGDVVNTAARIQKGCMPGSVLVSQATRDIVEAKHPGRFRFGDAFGLQAKGKRDELAVCNVKSA
jgi:class 3 adenylate cyclase